MVDSMSYDEYAMSTTTQDNTQDVIESFKAMELTQAFWKGVPEGGASVTNSILYGICSRVGNMYFIGLSGIVTMY